MKIRQHLSSVAITVVVSIVLVFAVDWSLAFLGYGTEAPLKTGYPANFFRVNKNLEFSHEVRANSLGIRYHEISLEKRRLGDRRIVVLGDSFTEGLGVESEHTFLSLLEKKFTTPERRVEFVNCGQVGASPLDYARVLQNIGFRYNPDAVLAVLYANDVGDVQLLTDEEIETGEGWLFPRKLHRRGIQKIIHGLWPRVYVLSHRFQKRIDGMLSADILSATRREARRRRIPEDEIEAWVERVPVRLVEAAGRQEFNGYLLTGGLLRPEYWTESLDANSEKALARWRVMTAVLAKIASWCRNRGIPFAITFAPCPYQYDPSFKSVPVGIETKREWLEGTEIEKRLAEWAALRSIPFFNMTLGFREEGRLRPGALQYPLDGHWNPEGHRVAARLLADWIPESGLLEP